MKPSKLVAMRIKDIILEYGTYKMVSQRTGISQSTLVRIAAGRTEPRFCDVISLCKLTNSNIESLAYGSGFRRYEDTKFGGSDEIDKAIDNIMWNLNKLDESDVLLFSKIITALNKS
ncbi:helix-turn-helix domain-containing protein [Lonsdalea quercina]|uniref:helix-turn-helix domain-containing protein n=1 Tax=Lonsdalea quercina TaxID=71657 RepID=UPI0039761D40